MHEVVTKVAERNPQKLRQIGLNYDIANARGLADPTEEEQKQSAQKKKAEVERKKKADKEKSDFEAWKKVEKEEYETWKREKKEREPKTDAGKVEGQGSNAGPVPTGTEPSLFTDPHPCTSAGGDGNKSLGPEGTKTENVVKETEHVKKTEDQNANDVSDNGNSADQAPREGPELYNRASSKPTSRGRRSSPDKYRHQPFMFYGDEPAQEPDQRAESPVDDKPRPWNAVCVLGLRVYSQDPEVSINLVKPKNVEEGAILDVGGDTAAGATM